MKFVLQAGYPPERKTAPLHRRYVGMFYYSAYFRKWDEVLGVKLEATALRCGLTVSLINHLRFSHEA